MANARSKINLLDSSAQTMDRKMFILGLDAELLPVRGRDVLWPHKHKCPQERGSKIWMDDRADWHGDGYAFELCVKPTHCLDVMMAEIGEGMLFLNRALHSSRFDNLGLDVPTIYEVPARVAASAPAEVRRLGCSPSLNVYGDPGKPESLGKTERTTGCHLHISHPWLDHDKAKLAVKWADILVGNAWNYVSPEDPAVEARRREAYGRAGEHRRNKYPDGSFGFEYRVLPGRVLGNPVYLSLMFNLLRWAVVRARYIGEPDELLSRASVTAINKADKSLSAAILERLPFTRDSRRVLAHLNANPRPTLDAMSWHDAGDAGNGHVVMFWSELSEYATMRRA